MSAFSAVISAIPASFLQLYGGNQQPNGSDGSDLYASDLKTAREVRVLSYLLGIIQDFERRHSRRPQLICVNTRHMCELMNECPDLFADEHVMPLGFRIMVLSEEDLPHPKAVWMPPRRRASASARPAKGRRFSL